MTIQPLASIVWARLMLNSNMYAYKDLNSKWLSNVIESSYMYMYNSNNYNDGIISSAHAYYVIGGANCFEVCSE